VGTLNGHVALRVVPLPGIAYTRDMQTPDSLTLIPLAVAYPAHPATQP
jgi:hypothetical protein